MVLSRRACLQANLREKFAYWARSDKSRQDYGPKSTNLTLLDQVNSICTLPERDKSLESWEFEMSTLTSRPWDLLPYMYKLNFQIGLHPVF